MKKSRKDIEDFLTNLVSPHFSAYHNPDRGTDRFEICSRYDLDRMVAGVSFNGSTMTFWMLNDADDKFEIDMGNPENDPGPPVRKMVADAFKIDRSSLGWVG